MAINAAHAQPVHVLQEHARVTRSKPQRRHPAVVIPAAHALTAHVRQERVLVTRRNPQRRQPAVAARRLPQRRHPAVVIRTRRKSRRKQPQPRRFVRIRSVCAPIVPAVMVALAISLKK